MRRSFTLIELLVVVVILGILASLAIPQYTKAVERAKGKEAIANLKLIKAAEEIWLMEYNTYTVLGDLNLELNQANWSYNVPFSGAATFTATAKRKGIGGYLNCVYTITESDDEPIPNADCP